MEKLFLSAKEVAEILNISQQLAYKIIRNLNKQLSDRGYLILRGRVNKRYFLEQIYQSDKEES